MSLSMYMNLDALNSALIDSEDPEKKGFLDKYVFLGFRRIWLSTQIL